MKIDNRRWFLVAVCLPCLGFILFNSAFVWSVIARRDPVTPMLIWAVVGVAILKYMLDACAEVHVSNLEAKDPSTWHYRGSGTNTRSIRLKLETPHYVSLYGFGVGFYLFQILAMFVPLLLEGFLMSFLRIHISLRTAAAINCLLCITMHVPHVVSTRRYVVSEALRVYYHRRGDLACSA